MRKLICTVLALLLIFPLITGCASSNKNDKIKIVCTMFPQYDWVKNILGDSRSVELSLIIDNGTDPHSYQPTTADIMNISNCNMLVTLGGDSEKWVSEALESTPNTNIKNIKLAEIEGMTLHDISSSSHDHDENEHIHGAFDEHIWLSLKNAMTAVSALTDEICKLDESNASTYRQNADAYLLSLSNLDREYRQTVNEVPKENRFMLFADRFPFVYLLYDYGIDYQAAFDGCTTDVDADFDTVIKLVSKADERGVSHVVITESSDGSLAQTVVSSAKKKDVKIITMNSLQKVSKKDAENGVSYISVMEENLSALKTALGIKGE